MRSLKTWTQSDRSFRLSILISGIILLVSFVSMALPWQASMVLAQGPAAPDAVTVAGGDDFGSGLSICPAPITPVDLVNPTVVTNCTQAGLQAALTTGGHISFDCGPNPVTIPVSSPLETSATQDTVIDGGGLITLDGQNTTRILEKPFTPGSQNDKTLGNDLTIQNMRFINAKAPAATKHQDGNARGGAVWATSPGTRLHIINSTFENNATTSLTDEDNQGGAVFAANIYETMIVGSVFTNNEAGNGGAFGAIASGLVIYNSRFTNNKASDASDGGVVRGHGGAIHLDGVTNSFNPDSNKIVDICGSVFEGNTAIRGGGAIKTTISDNKGTKATYARSTFSHNRLLGVPPAEGHGGAIYHIEDDFANGFSEDNLEISQNTFNDNQTYRQGGGVWYLVNGQVRVENNTFYNNRANDASLGMGGALVVGGDAGSPTQEIINNTFANNYAWFHGGGIQAPGNPTVKLTNNIFYYNESERDWANYQMNREADVDGGGNIQYPQERFNQSGTPNDNPVTPGVQFVDPLLSAPADNGGFNQTMALQSGSPAIDAGASGCPAVDQRDAARIGNCDSGAFEFGGVPPTISTLTLNKRATDLDGALPYTQTVAYRIEIRNTSTAIAQNVVMTDTLPGEIVFSGWVEQNGAGQTGGVVAWGPQDIAGGQTETIIFTVDLNTSPGTSIANLAEFSSSNGGAGSDTAVFTAGQPPEQSVFLPVLLTETP